MNDEVDMLKTSYAYANAEANMRDEVLRETLRELEEANPSLASSLRDRWFKGEAAVRDGTYVPKDQ